MDNLEAINTLVHSLYLYEDSLTTIIEDWQEWSLEIGEITEFYPEVYYIPVDSTKLFVTFARFNYYSDSDYAPMAPDTISVPVKFIENPDQFKKDHRISMQSKKEKDKQRKIETAQNTISDLESKLLKAKSDLYKLHAND